MIRFTVYASDGRVFRDIWAYSARHAEQRVFETCYGRVEGLHAVRS